MGGERPYIFFNLIVCHEALDKQPKVAKGSSRLFRWYLGRVFVDHIAGFLQLSGNLPGC